MTRVYVYRNLRTGGYSLMVRGKVVGHKNELSLSNCEFRVRPGGRRRVLTEKQKNVHAFVIGDFLEGSPTVVTAQMERVSYNPYMDEAFVTGDSRKPVETAVQVILNAEGCFAIF